MPLLCPKSVDIFLFSLLVHEILHAVEHFRHKIKHAVDRCRRRDGHGHHARQTVLDDEERDGVDLDARTCAAAEVCGVGLAVVAAARRRSRSSRAKRG